MSTLDTYCTVELADELIERCTHTNGMEFVSDDMRARLIKAIEAEHTAHSLWYMYILALVIAFTCIVGVLGYILCFEASSLGGWLPFITIILGPLVGFAARSAIAAQKER